MSQCFKHNEYFKQNVKCKVLLSSRWTLTQTDLGTNFYFFSDCFSFYFSLLSGVTRCSWSGCSWVRGTSPAPSLWWPPAPCCSSWVPWCQWLDIWGPETDKTIWIQTIQEYRYLSFIHTAQAVSLAKISKCLLSTLLSSK